MPSKGSTNHPCSRSLEHVEWLIEKFTEPGSTVLDPFMGSGTTGIAALRRGRNFIGMEIEPNFYREAVIRLREG
ncbi:MAG: site-specific DNA-methyltransferase [Acaryochloris sp. RU_4_1]|nr:site-specific DNA-methyltransferase [Acaryochloris sp. RU_4_1]NJR56963.1 site-specific DNA-methyltransferase [Acaryochloris sp. CRU_2_0]